MKIIVATPLYPPEGEKIAVYAQRLAKHLAVNHQVTVLTYGYKIAPVNNLSVIVIDKTKPLLLRLFNYFKSLFFLAKNHDLIYLQNAGAIGLPAILVKYLTGRPVVINFFEDEAFKRAFNQGLTDQPLEVFLSHPPLNSKIRRLIKIQGWVLRRASLVVVSSKYLADLISEHYRIPLDKIVVNYVVEDRDEKLSLPMDKNNHLVIASGSLLDWTGLDQIIEALAIVKEKINNIQLIIIGQGKLKKGLQVLTEKLGLTDNIKFFGRVSKAENWYLLNTASVYVHNFFTWDQNNQITQSFLAKTPVLAQDNQLHREILSKNVSGLLFAANQKEELARQLEKILTDDELREKLIVFASKNLADNFSWNIHLNNLSNVFSSVLEK